MSSAGLVFVERGGWRRRTRREGEVVLDTATVTLELFGEPSTVAHLPGVRDHFTRVSLQDGEADELASRVPRLLAGPVPVPISVLLAHADLLAARRAQFADGDVAELAGRLLSEVDRSLRSRVAPGASIGKRSPLVEAVRAGLQVQPGQRVAELSAVGASRSHVSRTFRRDTGLTVTEYRSRLRVAAAVHALADGAGDLADLAAELGFADHSHLTRSIRATTDATPSDLRRRFAFAA